MKWFRFYTEALEDPKVQKLDPDLFKIWVNLLCIASRNDGVFPPIEDVSFSLRTTISETQEAFHSLVKASLIDEIKNQHTLTYSPHNWNKRQYKSDTSTSRVKRFRKRKETVSVTPPDSDTEQTQIQNRITPISPKGDFDSWWKIYPEKVGKGAAAKAYAKAMKISNPEELVSGVKRYIETKPADRPWCNPATWLNQERWKDQPADAKGATFGNGHLKLSDFGGNWPEYKKYLEENGLAA